MNPLLTHLTQELRATFRSPPRLLMAYLFPLGFYAMMGLVMTELNPTFRELLVPSMAIFCLLSNAVLGMPGPLVEERLAGVHRGFRIHGVPIVAVVVAPALAAALHGMIGATLVALSGPLLFGGTAPGNWAAFYAVLVVTALALAAIGALIGVVAKSASMSVLLSQAIFLPSMLLGGIMISLEQIPATFRPVVGALPSTYAMQAFADLANGQAVSIAGSWGLLLLGSGTIAAFSLAIWLYTWDPQGEERRPGAHPLYALLALLPYVIGGATLLGMG